MLQWKNNGQILLVSVPNNGELVDKQVHQNLKSKVFLDIDVPILAMSINMT